jgi:hypothetical protein
MLDIRPSPTWKSYAAATIADVDAIKTSIATSTSTAQYTGAALNGALGASAIRFPQCVSVTTSSSVGSYNTSDPIVFTGTDKDGGTITASLTLTQADGNETIVDSALQGFASVTQIDVPAQVDTNGAFEFGVRDVVLDPPAQYLVAGANGNAKIVDQDGNADTMAMIAGYPTPPMAIARVSGEAATTAFPLLICR